MTYSKNSHQNKPRQQSKSPDLSVERLTQEEINALHRRIQEEVAILMEMSKESIERKKKELEEYKKRKNELTKMKLSQDQKQFIAALASLGVSEETLAFMTMMLETEEEQRALARYIYRKVDGHPERVTNGLILQYLMNQLGTAQIETE